MAKALLGHVCGPDQRMATELRRLRQRVGDLEAELARLKEQRGVTPPPGSRPAATAQPPEHNGRGRTEFPGSPTAG